MGAIPRLAASSLTQAPVLVLVAWVQREVTSCGLEEALNGWEAGKVEDAASNNVHKRIFSRALLLSGDGEVGEGDLREGEDQRAVLTPGALSAWESFRGCRYTPAMPMSTLRWVHY